MKRLFRLALILWIAASLFMLPSPTLAKVAQPDDPPPGASLIAEGVPVEISAQDQPGADAQPQALRGPYTKTLTGLDFHPTHSNLTYSSTNGGLFPLALVSSYGFYADYHLPGGAQVTGVTFYLVDNDAAVDISVSAHRYNPATSVNDSFSSISTTGSSASIQAVSLSVGLPFLIDNYTYAYRLRVYFSATGGSQAVYGARITYNLPVPALVADDLTLAGADFQSSSSLMTYEALGGEMYATAYDPTYPFIKRVEIPDGAVIYEVDWYLVDNADPQNFMAALTSHVPSTNDFDILTSRTTTGIDPATQMLTRVIDIPIDNKTKSYAVIFQPGAAASTLRVVGARVRYSLPTALDYAAPQVKTISGINFSPSGSDLTYRAFGLSMYALALYSGRSFQASLNLPNAARINRITFYFIDASDFNFSLVGRYYYPQTGSFTDPVFGNSSGNQAEIQSLTFSGIGAVMGLFDASTMVSRLRVSFGEAGTSMYLMGASVEYFYPKASLPLILR